MVRTTNICATNSSTPCRNAVVTGDRLSMLVVLACLSRRPQQGLWHQFFASLLLTKENEFRNRSAARRAY